MQLQACPTLKCVRRCVARVQRAPGCWVHYMAMLLGMYWSREGEMWVRADCSLINESHVLPSSPVGQRDAHMVRLQRKGWRLQGLRVSPAHSGHTPPGV